MLHRLQQHLRRRGGAERAGVYSVCSAHPWVIRAAAEQAVADNSRLLVEATSNQVNQFGGYTGMRPIAFRAFVEGIAAAAGLPLKHLILGGDHLGPNPWRALAAEEAMQRGERLVAEYVAAGFTKIHLDASMACGGDRSILSDEEVAVRAVRLCEAAETARNGVEAPVYAIGTEVPTPGGAMHALDGLQVTAPSAAAHTLAVHKAAFTHSGLAAVWPRVIALVVQPGVEFDHDTVISYDRAKSGELVAWLREQNQVRNESIVFEAHSTDYQQPVAYKELVQDGFSILKVGPALTFAMREALYALEDMEGQLIAEPERSHLAEVMEATMQAEPGDWQAHYQGDAAQQQLLRVYSYSDRIRYYWQKPQIAASVERLVANLSDDRIPETMLSRYLPAQYSRARSGEIGKEPVSLVVNKIRDVLRVYAAACPNF